MEEEGKIVLLEDKAAAVSGADGNADEKGAEGEAAMHNRKSDGEIRFFGVFYNRMAAICCAVGYLVLLLAVTNNMHEAGWFRISAMLFLLAVPVFILGAYSSVIRKTHRLMLLAPDSWLTKLFGGSIFAILKWWIIASIVSVMYLCQIARYTFFENLIFGIFFIFLIMYRFEKSMLSNLFIDFYKAKAAYKWAACISCIICGLVVAAYNIIVYPGVPYTLSMETALNFTLKDVLEHCYNTESMITISVLSAYMSAFKIYLASELFDWAFGFLNLVENYRATALAVANFAVSSVGGFVYAVALHAVFSVFVIPRRELRRIFCSPTQEATHTNKISIFVFCLMGALVALLMIEAPLILEPACKDINEELFSRSFIGRVQERSENTYQHSGLGVGGTKKLVMHKGNARKNVLQLEKITVSGVQKDVKPGTISRLKKMYTYEMSNAVKLRYMAGIDSAADMMIRNIDKYLDWYFTLKADYMRLVSVLSSTAANSVQVEASKIISDGVDFDFYKQLTDIVQIKKEQVSGRFERIIDNCKVVFPDGPYTTEVLGYANLSDILSIVPDTPEFTAAFDRVKSSAVVGAAGGAAVGAKVLSKTSGKVVAKIAAKTAAKTAGKSGISALFGGGGAATGAGIGATVGSVIPGAGTAIGGTVGAAIGGIISGVAAWFAADKVLLEAEELMYRDEYRAELEAAINTWRREELDKFEAAIERFN